MKKTFITLLLAAVVALSAGAAAPNGSGTYYSAANGKKGAALKTALCGIIYNRTEKSYEYLWTFFNNYDVRSDGKIWDMYSDNTYYVPGGSAQGHNYSGEGDSYNREHSFPKSWFGGDVKPMYTDLHHMYPTDGFVNNKRSNFPFGETNGNSYTSHNNFSKLGSCTYPGYTGTVFEPADEYKGDFARTYFYMITCYEEKLYDWYSGNADGVRATIDGSEYPGFQLWQLNMLLTWAKDDPVSTKETNRNNAVYGVQNNRNPFIDYPGLEQYIWGSMKDDAFSYNNYVEPTTYTGYNDGSGQGGEGGETGEGGTDIIDLAFTGVTANSTSYSDWSDKGGSTSSAVYAGNSAGGNNSIQLRSSNSNSGIVTTTSGGKVTKVKVTWNSNTTSGRTLDIYGKNTAYSAATNLYDSSEQGTKLGSIVYGTSTELVISGDYTYVGLRSNSGAMYLDKIEITWDNGVVKTDPSFNELSDVNVDYGSSLTLTKGTSGTENFVTNGNVTLSCSNTAVATVSGLTITPVAVGTALITVTTSSSTNYNAGSVMFPITVNAPEGKTTAAATQSSLLFGESFGNNSSSARAWNDSYSVKSGVSSVYSGITGYTVTNAKQSKNTVGSTLSGLMGTQDTDASIIIGPLNVADYKNLSLTYQWKAGSIGATYYTKAYYATSANGSYTELTGTGNGATTFVTRSYSLPEAAQVATLYLKIVWKTSNTQGVIDEVQLSGTSPATLTATLNSFGYGTFCSEYPLDFSDYETADYSAWQVTGVDGETISFEQVTDIVKGGTGLLLKGEPNATVTLSSAASTNVLSSNLLYGTLAPTYVEKDTYYGLSNQAFVKVNPGTVPAGKALLPTSAIGSNEVKALTFIFDEDATAIESIQNSKFKVQNEDAAIFNLAGQRINKMQKGINIVNGKKVLF